MVDFTSIQTPVEKELLVCVYDLTGFTQFSRSKTSNEVFCAMKEFYSVTSKHVEAAGGLLIKFIGDAGLCVFPLEIASDAIESMLEMKHVADAWLKENIPGSFLAVNCHVGPATIGPTVGYGGKTQIDVAGDTVNTCFTLGRKEFILSPQAFRSLKPEARKRFRKYTPPIIYKLGERN